MAGMRGYDGNETLPGVCGRPLMLWSAYLTSWKAGEPSWRSVEALVGDLLRIYGPGGWYHMEEEQPDHGCIVEACGEFDRLLLLLWSPMSMERVSHWCRGWLGMLLELWQSILYDFEFDF